MKDRIEALRGEAVRLIAACPSRDALDALRVRFLGRKGAVTAMLRGLKDLPPGERPAAGQAVNGLRDSIAALLDERLAGLRGREEEAGFRRETIDVTLPGVPVRVGARHPIPRVMERITGIFAGLGFDVEEGPEVETDRYNFAALNFPADHPARDMQATLYVDDSLLLRTHTSPVQVRVMERRKPPLRCSAYPVS